eukprot:781062_1
MTRTTAVEQSSADGVEPSRDGAMKSTDHVEQRERAIRVKQSRAHGSAQSVEATKVTVVAPAKADLATQAKADLTTQANAVLTTHAKAGLTTHATTHAEPSSADDVKPSSAVGSKQNVEVKKIAPAKADLTTQPTALVEQGHAGIVVEKGSTGDVELGSADVSGENVEVEKSEPVDVDATKKVVDLEESLGSVGSKNAGCTPKDRDIINTDEFTEQWMRKINGCMWPWGHSKNLKNCLVKAFKKTGLLTEACMQCSVDLIMCRKCTSGPFFRFKKQQTEKDRKEKERCSNECLEQYKKCKRG